MEHALVQVGLKGILPTDTGFALFLGNTDKTFIIHIDTYVGDAIRRVINAIPKERPLTHDLIKHILIALGAKVDRVIINDVQDATFFARVFMYMENELGKKIIEVDARPSDATVFALQNKCPLYVTQTVFDSQEDMTDVLKRIHEQQQPEERDDD